MDFSFEQALLRLKQQVGVKTDKEIAALLGLSASALNTRKKRGNFPETELYALAAKLPDIKLDVGFVLHGDHLTQDQRRTLQVAAAHPPSSNPDLGADIAGAFLAMNARRKARYLEIIDALNSLSDATVDLVLPFLNALYQAEQQNAKINAHNWRPAKPEDF